MSAQCQDLGEQVQRLDDNYFAYGDHSDAYKGRHRGQTVVIKQLRGVNTNKTDVRDNLLQNLKEQVLVWEALDHPNVCKVFGITTEFGFLPALILPYYEKGNIIKYIIKNEIQSAQRTKWVSEVASGLAYLHDKGVYHGDLRGTNIFLDSNDQAVIADYGIAQYFANSDFTSAKSIGNVRWMAPELVALPAQNDILSGSTDVYALAMVMLEIFSGKPPFSDKTDTAVIFSIARHEKPKLPEEITGNEVLQRLFDDCTGHDPAGRPAAADVAETLRSIVPNPTPTIFRRILKFLRLM